MSANEYTVLEDVLERMRLKLKGLELDKKMTERQIKELKKDIRNLNWLLS
jgi:chaperonin cofactor prefoldin